MTPMPPRREAPGAIPMLLHAALVGLRERNEVSLVTVFGDEPGDAEAVAALAEAGIDVHAVDTRVRSARARRRRQLRLAGTWARGRYPWRTAWFADPRVQKAIDGLTAARSFDVAAIEDNAMGVFRLPAGLPAVLAEYEVRRPRPIEWRPGPPRAWPGWAFRESDWRRWPAYERRVWTRFDRLQVVTREDAATVAEIAPDLAARVRVNPFGIDVPPELDPASEQEGTLLFTGNFTHPPNVDAAEFLARDVVPRIAAARLVIAGNAAARRVGHLAGAAVEVVDAPERIEPHLAAAAVVLAPVRTGGGMRMKVLQALAAGKPVVTTARGARGFEPDGDPPFVVADDAAGIADAAERLLRDRAARRTLGARARRFAIDRHSPDAYADRLERVYAEAIEAARARR